MRSIMTTGATACLAILLLGGMSTDEGSSVSASNSEAHESGGIAIERIIAIVARKTGKKYLIDPRVRAQVLIIGEEPASITYSELLTILQVHGFIAVEGGGYVRVLPDANARQTAHPLIVDGQGGQNYPDAQFVTAVMTVKNIPAAQLVPILRPLLPQYAQLATYPCTNSLLMSDHFENVKRIEAIVKALDVGTPYKYDRCEGSSAASHGDNPPRRD